MKRFIGILLTLTLAMGSLFAVSPALALDTLPALGDQLHGFTVTEVSTEQLIDAPRITLTHDQTGATVVYYAADDIDCSFDISFRTPNLNSKGISHVFEHATISGSEKYPSQNLFFPMITQTYNTFANAMTYDSATTYPVSSMSEDQLLLLADYYLDGLFNPLIYTEERLYKREAWRYALESADAPLTITGTVYNEMRGNDTIQSAAMYDLRAALFPDSIQSNVNGGDPDVIPEMTWQDLTDFHTEYYHPSNAIVFLYGNMDYARFLELLDRDYFSHYERKEIEVETGKVAPQPGLVERVEEFAVEAGSPTEDASVVQYAFVTNDITLDDVTDLVMLSALLSHEASPLTQAVRKALPGATFYIQVDYARPDPYINFHLEGVDADDRELFREIVDDSLAAMAQGISPELVDAILAGEEFSLLLIPEQQQMGVNLSLSNMLIWSVWDSIDYYNLYLEKLPTMKENATNGYFEGLIETYLLGNEHAALVATVPAPGKAEEKAAALAETLAAKKADMSEEEIAQLVEETAAIEAWSQEEPPKELLESLTAVTADTLPEETKIFDIVEAEQDGYTIMTSQAAVGPIGSTNLILNTSAVPQDMLHYLTLYNALLGEMDTETYSREELQTLLTRYLYGFGTSASGIRNADGTYVPALQANWMSLTDEYETGLALANEVLFHTKLEDLDVIQDVIGRQKVNLRTTINSMSFLLQMTRAQAARSEYGAYNDYLTGLDYYTFLSTAEAMVADEPETLLAALADVQAMVRNKQNATVLFAGNEESIDTFNATLSTLFDGVEATEAEAAAYAFEAPAEREGLIVDSSVQYNLLYSSMDALGIEYSAKLQPLGLLIYDGFLTPQIRHGIGAYDNINSFDEEGLLFLSYRDPSVADTYAVYASLPEYVESVPVTQEDLDRYIVSSYSSYALPQGELSGAMRALSMRFTGRPDDEKLIRMREIKATTVEDLRALGPVFEQLLETGVRSTSGGAAIINEYADLFDAVITVSE